MGRPEGLHGVQGEQVRTGAGLPQQPALPGGEQLQEPKTLSDRDHVRRAARVGVDAPQRQNVDVGERRHPIRRHRARSVLRLQRRACRYPARRRCSA
jgi:hypothetical protein